MLAGFVLGAILVHDLGHVRGGRAHDVLWVCNVAALLPGLALLLRSSLLATVALTWLVPGTTIWLTDVALGAATILPTSWGIHVGGAIASAWAVARFGRSRRAFFASLALVLGCFVLALLFVSPEANVNAAHRVPTGWSFLGASRASFLAVAGAITIVAALFGQLLSELIARAGRRLFSG